MVGSNRGSNAKQQSVAGGSEKRRRRSVLERRQIVEETLAPGASVARGAGALLSMPTKSSTGARCKGVGYWAEPRPRRRRWCP
jgi:hypothetical protein